MIASEYRPCLIHDVKCMFHCWINEAKVIPPSMMVGGHRGGQLWDVLALVETEDGHMMKVYPSEVIFTDGGKFEMEDRARTRLF